MRRLSLAVLIILVASCARDAKDVTGPPNLSRTAAELAPVYQMTSPHRIADEYLVRFTDDVDDSEALTQQILSSVSASVVSPTQARAIVVWKGLKGFWGKLPAEAIPLLRANPRIKYIEANTRMPTSITIQNITPPDGNWGLDRIDQWDTPLDGTYSYSHNGTGVRVWIVDTGVDDDAPELSGRIDYLNKFSNGGDPFAPCHNHGTRMAILAAGSIHGVAKGAMINVARVSEGCTGTLNVGAASSAFEYIADYSPRPAIANYSASRECTPLGCWQTVDDAINYAISHGVQVVVSAGNDDEDACDYTPAHVANALTVGASRPDDYRAIGFTNYGSCLDLFAPGFDVSLGGGDIVSGASVSAALVTGVAAVYLQQQPSASPASVRSFVLGSTSNNTLQNVGAGSPNKLLHIAPVLPPPPPLTITISGPATVRSGLTCLWTATPTTGVAPYTYSWYVNDFPVNNNSPYPQELIYTNTGSAFTVKVLVYDAAGAFGTKSKSVTISPTAPQCLF